MSKSDIFKSSVIGMQGNLMSFALKLTTNKDEAHDLVQETCLTALNNEDKFVEKTNFKGWILTIMRNIFITNYRRSAKENTIIDATEDLYYLNSASVAGGERPDGVYIANEISNILSGFPEDNRQPFSMHVAGYKYEEIATALNLPIGTVKNRIFLTRKRLRAILTDYR